MSDYRIVYSDELYHYGVPGMRWGHRKREAKTEYRRRLGASLDKYDKTIERIEKPYKRGQTLSKKDQERERKALNTQVREADKAKADYKKAKADIKAEKKEYKQSAEYKAKRAKAIKVGAAVAGTALAAYGAYKLNDFVREKNQIIRFNEGKAKCDRMIKKLDRMRVKDLASTGGPNERFFNNTSSNAKAGFQYNNNGTKVTLARQYRKTNPTLNRKQYRNIENKIVDKTINDALNKADNDSFRTAAKNVSKYYLEETKRKVRKR